jgi:hypothetical protein
MSKLLDVLRRHYLVLLPFRRKSWNVHRLLIQCISRKQLSLVAVHVDSPIFGIARIGHSRLAPATSVLSIRDSTQNVNLGMTLTTLASQPAPLRMGMLVNTTARCYKAYGSMS